MTAAAVIAQPTWTGRALLRTLRLAVAAAELWIAHAWLGATLAPAALLLAHALVVALFLSIAWSLRDHPGTGLWADAVLLLLAGPLAVIALVWRRRPAHNAVTGLIGAGVEAEVADADRLDAEIVAGRRPRHDPENRASLMDRILSGSLAEQQAAIAMLSLNYRAELHPVLMAGLQSPTPAIRVQSAAAFAKLRERFGADVKRLLAPELPGEAAAQLRARAAACRELARSPFAEESVAAALRIRATALDAEIAAVEPPALGAARPLPEPAEAEADAPALAFAGGERAA
jgi:hypothetical protein